MAQLPYMAPAQLISLRAKAGTKLVVGDVLDFHEGEIQMAPHPTFGAIPQILVTSITDDGRFAGGEFTCQAEGCEETVHVHPGDVFQKRRCPSCQKKHQGKAKRGIKSPEDEARVAAEREAKKAEKAANKAKSNYEAALAKAEKAKADAEARLAKLQAEAKAKSDLIKAEAERQGAAISEQAPVVA